MAGFSFAPHRKSYTMTASNRNVYAARVLALGGLAMID